MGWLESHVTKQNMLGSLLSGGLHTKVYPHAPWLESVPYRLDICNNVLCRVHEEAGAHCVPNVYTVCRKFVQSESWNG